MKLCVLGEPPQEPCWDAAVSSLVRKSHPELEDREPLENESGKDGGLAP